MTPITPSGYSGCLVLTEFCLLAGNLASAQWQQLVASMVAGLAHKDFYEKFSAGCEYLSGFQSTMVVWASTSHRPIHLYDDLPDEYADKTIADWFAGAYLVDPFYGLFVDKAPDGIYRLQDLAPDNFFDSEYYRSAASDAAHDGGAATRATSAMRWSQGDALVGQARLASDLLFASLADSDGPNWWRGSMLGRVRKTK